MKPALLAATTLALVLSVASCSAPRPAVTFYGNRTAVDVQPFGWCDKEVTQCPVDPAQIGVLAMAANQPLQVNVPAEVGDTVWRVLWASKGGNAVAASGASNFFTDRRLAYTIPALGPGEILTKVEVQAGIIAFTAADGTQQFGVTSSWELMVQPKIPIAS